MAAKRPSAGKSKSAGTRGSSGASGGGGDLGPKLVLYPLALVGALYVGGQAYTALTGGRAPSLPGMPGAAHPRKAGGRGSAHTAAHVSGREEAAVAPDRREAEPESRVSERSETTAEPTKKRRRRRDEHAGQVTETTPSPTPSTELRSILPPGRPSSGDPSDPASSPVPAGTAEPKLDLPPAKGTGAASDTGSADLVRVRSVGAAGPTPRPAGAAKTGTKLVDAPSVTLPGTPKRGAVPPVTGPAPPELPAPGIGNAEHISPVPPLEIARGAGRRREVALTFDAGADYRPAQKILDTLKSDGLQCTFFLTGEWVQKNPRTTRRIASEGHEIGNHSWNHPAFTTLGESDIRDQLRRTEAIIEETTGKSSRPYFRPPLGARDMRVRRVVGDEGFYTVYWTLDSHDSVVKGITSDQVRDRILEKVAPGSIVLLHCGSQASADALPEIISGLKAKGLNLVSVSRLLSE